MSISLLCRLDALLVQIYATLSVTALASVVNPWLAALAAHGKTRLDGRRDNEHVKYKASPSQGLFRFIESLVVPKRFFWHFYVVGLLALGACVWLSPSHKHDYQTLVLVMMIAIHLSRRWLECLLVHAWRAESRMHLAGYCLGLLHYLLLPFVFCNVGSCHDNDHAFDIAGTTAIAVSLVALLLNVWAQYQQHRHHVLLASLRRAPATNTTTSSRSVSSPYSGPPRQAWFHFVACPHYLAEILIYASLVLAQPTTRSLALLVWVAVNLTVSARSNHAWYLANVPGYKERNLCIIVPGIL